MQPPDMLKGQIKLGSIITLVFVLKTDPAFHPALQLAGSVPRKERSGKERSRVQRREAVSSM